jgi:hypothetical protein
VPVDYPVGVKKSKEKDYPGGNQNSPGYRQSGSADYFRRHLPIRDILNQVDTNLKNFRPDKTGYEDHRKKEDMGRDFPRSISLENKVDRPGSEYSRQDEQGIDRNKNPDAAEGSVAAYDCVNKIRMQK